MKYLVTSEEMKKYDTYTINEIGIPAEVLMERAALFSLELIDRYRKEQKKSFTELKVLIVAGCGNNGGDGLAVGRLLLDRECPADFCLVGSRDKTSTQTALQLSVLEKYGVVPSPIFPEREYDIIVDALFGIGLGREVTGEYREAIERINASKAWKLALDVPSGVDATTGKVWGVAVKADMTVTFAYEKRGLALYPGKAYGGQIAVGDIGITDRSFGQCKPEMFTYKEPVTKLLPARDPAGNKGTFGKVLIFAGSETIPGAMMLCAKAAFRSGVGMVKVISFKENQVLLQKAVPEAMFLPMTESQSEIQKSIEWADCLLAGPGLGNSSEARAVLKLFLTSHKPLVLDADGLNLLAEDEELQSSLLETILDGGKQVIMTPHVGELSRLLKRNIGELKEEPVKAARRAAQKYECTFVCKDAGTVVCQKTGPVYLNTCGNSGMATAGSGDVLAGILAALCAGEVSSGQKKCTESDIFSAATLGVYLHGKAGDYAAAEKGEAAVMASDLIEALPVIQKGKENGK